AGATLGRNITDEHGQFRLPALLGGALHSSNFIVTSTPFATPVIAAPAVDRSAAPWREQLRAFANVHLQHTAWGVAHAQRDYELTLRLAEAERVVVDSDAVYAAAYLHDMGAFPEFAQTDVDHGVRSGQLVAEQLIAIGFPAEKIALVRDIVEHHMYYHSPGASPEALLFRDADTLDFLGAIGIARICSITTRHRWATDLSAAIATLRKNAMELPGTLHFASARREANARVAVMRTFLDAIDADVGRSRAY
ncbi:MAG: HD domain-containing protein, partial [bacterium]